MRTYGAVVKVERTATQNHKHVDDDLYFETEAKGEVDAVSRVLQGALAHYPCSKVTLQVVSRLKQDRPVKEHVHSAFIHASQKGVHLVTADMVKQSNNAAASKALAGAKVPDNWPPSKAKPKGGNVAVKQTKHRLNDLLSTELFKIVAAEGTLNKD